MTESIEIRPMATADLAKVLALAESLPEAPYWSPSAYLKAIDPYGTPRRIALVGVKARPGAILAFTVASLSPPQAELETIVVVPENQRQGLGRLIFMDLAAKLTSAGAQELLLEVRASNQPALAFYHSLGFVQTGLRPGYYADPIEDAVLMLLHLG